MSQNKRNFSYQIYPKDKHTLYTRLTVAGMTSIENMKSTMQMPLKIDKPTTRKKNKNQNFENLRRNGKGYATYCQDSLQEK